MIMIMSANYNFEGTLPLGAILGYILTKTFGVFSLGWNKIIHEIKDEAILKSETLNVQLNKAIHDMMMNLAFLCLNGTGQGKS